MKNGTSRAVLVRDLFHGEGPFTKIADDFLSYRCSVCRLPVDGDARFLRAGYLCPTCAGLMSPLADA